MQLSKLRWMLLLLVSISVMCLIADGENESATPSLRKIEQAAKLLESLHKPKTPPAEGDWLSSHKEPGQTFSQYRRSRPNRPTKAHTTFYFQPVGEFSPAQQKIIAETADLMSRFYGLPTKVLDPIGLERIPEEARRVHPDWGDRQILSTYVLDRVLKPNLPDDAVAMLALTTSDLWPGEGWNFVFGQASLRDRVGVWSLYRYGDLEQEPELFRRRVFKVAVHESGHMLGIQHCTSHECLMNGSNHLREMDSRPMWFCPDDLQKIWWACGVDPAERFRSLAEFAGKHQLKAEADFWQESLKRLQAEK